MRTRWFDGRMCQSGVRATGSGKIAGEYSMRYGMCNILFYNLLCCLFGVGKSVFIKFSEKNRKKI